MSDTSSSSLEYSQHTTKKTSPELKSDSEDEITHNKSVHQMLVQAASQTSKKDLLQKKIMPFDYSTLSEDVKHLQKESVKIKKSKHNSENYRRTMTKSLNTMGNIKKEISGTSTKGEVYTKENKQVSKLPEEFSQSYSHESEDSLPTVGENFHISRAVVITSTPLIQKSKSVLDLTKSTKNIPTKSKKKKIKILKQASSGEDVEHNSLKNTFLSKFTQENPDLTKILLDESFTNFTSDDEVFLVRVPKNLHPQLLQDCKINNKIKLVRDKYVFKFNAENPIPVHILTRIGSRNEIKLIKFMGSLSVQLVMKSKCDTENFLPERNKVPFPENLKTRHPLFGAEYRDKVHLKESIWNKINSAVKKFNKQKQKSQRCPSISDRRTQCPVEDDETLIYNKMFGPASGNYSFNVKGCSTEEEKGKKRKRAKSVDTLCDDLVKKRRK